MVPSGRWMQRTVSDSWASRVSPPGPTAAHGRRAKPSDAASIASSTVVTSRVRASRVASAASYMAFWISSNSVGTLVITSSSGTTIFSDVSRRASVTAPAARSRGPSSTRTGMPFSSASVTRRPNDRPGRASTPQRSPAARNPSASRETRSVSAGSSLTGSTSTCVGASRGGIRSPLSSP